MKRNLIFGLLFFGFLGAVTLKAGQRNAPPPATEDALMVRDMPYGYRAYMSSTAFTVTLTTVTTAPTFLGSIHLVNPTNNNGPSYCQFFDTSTASGITVGTTAPKFFVTVASGTTTGAGTLNYDFGGGLWFDAGLFYACTTAPLNGTGPATSLYGSLFYR